MLENLKLLTPLSFKRLYHKTNNRLSGLNINSFSKLHLGCGDNLIDGWANIDFNGWKGVIGHNLTKPLPVKDDSISFIFSEHFIEHITREEGLALLKDCYRVLKPGGVVRIVTPDLKAIFASYENYRQNDAWKELGWTTGCQMLNHCVRDWGHQFIYDRNELHLIMKEAGFSHVSDAPHRDSEFVELQNLEHRPFDNDLIVEAVKS